MRKSIIFLITVILLISQVYPIYASEMPAFLCEIGLKFYKQGRTDEALHEFKKALIVDSDYQPAISYIQMIQQQITTPEEKKAEFIPPTFRPAATTPAGAITELLDLIEIQNEMIKQKKMLYPEIIVPLPQPASGITEKVVREKKRKQYPPQVLILEDYLEGKVSQSIYIEQDRSIMFVGKNISRFLLTEPNTVTLERKSQDELLVTGKDIGYTYLNIWDANGRLTLELLTVPPKPEGPTYEESLRITGQAAGTFKLRYALDWSSYEMGRRIEPGALERKSYSYNHNLNLNGETPYGNLDSVALVRKLITTTDLTYFTLGLTKGSFGPFKGFHIRGFDFGPSFSNLAFSGASLRGALLESPAFNGKVRYSTFWGREGGSRYGRLSPGLAKIKNSFLGGFNLDWKPSEIQDYNFSVLHGWGRDRETYLNDYGYDLKMNLKFDKVQTGYEVGYDSESVAHIANFNYLIPKFNLTAQIRDISKKYLSITGYGPSIGELGGLFSLLYAPTEKLNINSRLNLVKDRLYPATDNPNRWNEDFDWDLDYKVDDLTNVGLNYSLQNQLGRISQSRNQTTGANISKTFQLIKKFNTSVSANHQESKNYTSPSSDYINDKATASLRFSLLGDIYYYATSEFNWLTERYTGIRTQPKVFETGIDWYGQVFKFPMLFGNIRFNYHNEEETESTLSFLPGQDYIEGYAGLNYRTLTNKEFYCSTRVRNNWAERADTSKFVEVNFNAGMRYFWDTGIRWESVGSIEGYVFKDLNSDGLRQRDEPPVEGVKIWLGKDKSQTTDLFGYYKFKGIRGRKAYVNLDPSTLPSGFVLTVSVTQEAAIAHHQTVKIDFGIISSSEITGLVFEDVDGNNEYSIGDQVVSQAAIILDSTKTVKTDAGGRYHFYGASTGEHTIILDINSLPIYYLPQKALKEQLTLLEGATYIYNIPLRRVKE